MIDESCSCASDKIVISHQGRALWGKSDYDEGVLWLPLYMHLLDSVSIAGHLWDDWLPGGTRALLIAALGGEPQLARKMTCLIVGMHDIGKATPAFQGMSCGFGVAEEGRSLDWKPRKAGLPIRCDGFGRRTTPHPCASYIIIFDILRRKYGWDEACADAFAAIAGSHHGRPPERNEVPFPSIIRKQSLHSLYDLGWDDACGDCWTSVQEELFRLVVQASGLNQTELESFARVFIAAPAASLLVGLSIIADWIASNQELFPLVPLISGDFGWEDSEGSCLRCEPSTWDEVSLYGHIAWKRLGFIPA